MELDLGQTLPAAQLEYWQNEVDSANQYRVLQQLETDETRARIYGDLAAIEEKHIAFWESEIARGGHSIPTRKPSWRSQVLVYLAKKFGPDFVLSTIREQEVADRNRYAALPETLESNMASDERQHAKTLERMNQMAPKGVEGAFIAKIEGRHRTVGGNALRASVLGVNDGLCSNLSLVMGVLGLSSNEHTVLLTGLAGLFAGACSMALGEWLSVTNSRELADREIRIEANELRIDPESEKEELKLIYEGKGLSKQEAADVSEKLMSNPERALDTLTREELGLDPDERGGNPTEAALFSFVLFAIGAFIPIVPFLFASGLGASIMSIAFGAFALFGFGAATTVFTGQPVIRSGARQMALGLAAAGLTFGLGHLLGTHL